MITRAEREEFAKIQAKVEAAKLRGQVPELSIDEEKVLDAIAIKKNRAAIRNKALAGKPLSAREQKILSGDPNPNFAEGFKGLAPIVGVSRRTLQNWNNQFPDFPKPRADNRFFVQEVFDFMRKHGLAAVPNAANEIDIKKEREKLKLERERFEFEQLKERMLPVGQFEQALSKMLSAFLAALNAFPARVNEQLDGLNFDERLPVLEQEAELLKKTLAQCDYLSIDLPNDHEFTD